MSFMSSPPYPLAEDPIRFRISHLKNGIFSRVPFPKLQIRAVFLSTIFRSKASSFIFLKFLKNMFIIETFFEKYMHYLYEKNEFIESEENKLIFV